MIVDINKIEECLRYFKQINETPFLEIQWARGNECIKIDKEIAGDFLMTGLSNKDFPSIAGLMPDDIGIRVHTMILSKPSTDTESAQGEGES